MTESICHSRAAKADIAIALVSRVWAQACRAAGRAVTEPSAVVSLKSHKPGRKSGAYRLEGIAPRVIAKRCQRDTALVEQLAYERVLPEIGLSGLVFYGGFDDPVDPSYRWLLVEDAGSVKPMESDRAMVAEWLARLHTRSAALADALPFPERGPVHYLKHLQGARDNIERCVSSVKLSATERGTLEGLLRSLDRLEARWDAICTSCDALPRTLVHGDVARKNSRIRATPAGLSIVMLDWETAGWGPPGGDLRSWARPAKKTPGGWGGTVPLDVYTAAVASAWPSVTLHDVERQSAMGTVFRLVAGIRWASEALNVGGSSQGVTKLGVLFNALSACEDAPS